MKKRGTLNSAKWLLPGMRVKRWLALGIIGACIAMLGIALVNHGRPMDALSPWNHLIQMASDRWNVALSKSDAAFGAGLALLACGVGVFIYAFSQLTHSIATSLNPAGTNAALVDVVYRNRYLAQGPRVVVLGGGTGLSTMLRGLKQHTSNITAVVTVTDDGGSSGKLQKQLNILPPGDIRNCLVALADAEATMTDLFQYRFRGNGTGEGLRDHAFGNLLIAAMSEISEGDFERAVRETSRVLNIRGRVLPSTLKHVVLKGELVDGTIVEGETAIASAPERVKRITLSPDDAQPLSDVLEAIELADIIVIGPGSVFTSVIPNLLVQGIAPALRRSPAKKVYICNVMTQAGETDNFTASDHVKAIDAHVPRPVFDYVLVNTATPTLELLDKYRKSGATLVQADTDRLRKMGYRPITGNYISQTDVVRHDSGLLAEAIMRLLI